MTKIQKALDFNKLLSDQAKGKLLKKHLSFPLYAEIKMDGNYTVIIKDDNGLHYKTSGGHSYTTDKPTIFDTDVPHGVYIVERIGTDGKLGDRTTCALRGSKGSQVAYGHRYIIHDYLRSAEYHNGISTTEFYLRRKSLEDNFKDNHLVKSKIVNTRAELEEFLELVVGLGYEGLMLKDPNWLWKDTKSRTIECAKYKKRPTADLWCIGVTEGEGKYEGMIGALVLVDSQGREVSVGSGLNDDDRAVPPSYFINEVIEIDYEQIIDTYIQPTFITIRLDKTKEEID